MKKYLIIAATTQAARKFAEQNKLRPADCKIGNTTRSLDGISNLTAIFVEGWRARRDAFDMVQLVNQAEVHGVKFVEAKADQVLDRAGLLT